MARRPITKVNPYFSRKHGRTFRSEREYRNFLAKRKGYRSWYAQQKVTRSVRSARQLGALSRSQRVGHAKALEALSLMRRDGFTLSRAARRAGTTPETVHRYAGSALERRGGRVHATAGDTLLARMPVLTSQGPRELDVKGSRNRSLVGRHWNAIAEYLRSGETSQLEPFAGKGVSGFDLLTDPDEIDFWAPREPFSFEEIYDLTR